MADSLENRKCILTGKVAPKDELLRFVVLSDGRLLPDFNKKLEGRGVYLSNSKSLLTGLMQKERPLNKILHKNVILPEKLPQIIEEILTKKASDAINLARKSGDLVLGFEKVKTAIMKGTADFIIEAGDAGEDGKQKISAMAKNIEVISIFNVETISEALNRENTVYMAVLKGHASNMVKKALIRYRAFMND